MGTIVSVARTRIKICGITRPNDALAAVSAGADAIGLVFYSPSKRAVGIEQAAAIINGMPAFVTVTGLFVDENVDQVKAICAAVPLDLLQFHGEEAASYCDSFAKPYLKAIKVAPQTDLAVEAEKWPNAQGLLLDTWVEGQAGGTGQRFDWGLMPQSLRSSVVLAGGLNAGNVGDAICNIGPYAVDVSGGVEESPGIKSAFKIDEFVAAVKAADAKIRH